ncbi:hypothetical protein [Gloeocapsa sp. PCC 73106]|uniref:hypothetical protein n=1 Tax=Gloeocapsa sp. PCC 73106 TaxID=102232 RepID=UPI0002ABEFF4|nr:hypothetical protein [Gloeocapsa sp. PCC 73106]ELR97538.1 hypothetical protein GLO73106DRAFT_00013480 [Gloeocapsa sp. PCC 73106]
MDIEAQIDSLVQEAPQYGVPTEVMEKGVKPILRQLINDLNHQEYFICQNYQGDWIITTLSHRTQPNLEKKVIYAFGTSVDALQMQKLFDEEVVTVSIPVAQLVFQLFALKSVDSIVFMDLPGNLAKGKEITKSNLFELLQTQLQQFKSNLA